MTDAEFPPGQESFHCFCNRNAILCGAYFYAVTPHHSFAPPESAQGLLDSADSLAWGNRWTDAQPLYEKALHLFAARQQPSKALYAQVNEIPPDESGSIGKIVRLTQDLEGRKLKTRKLGSASSPFVGCWRRNTTRHKRGPRGKK